MWSVKNGNDVTVIEVTGDALLGIIPPGLDELAEENGINVEEFFTKESRYVFYVKNRDITIK